MRLVSLESCGVRSSSESLMTEDSIDWVRASGIQCPRSAVKRGNGTRERHLDGSGSTNEEMR
jgi:hypothetical protein